MLPSHKEGVLYLEHCRLAVADERLTFIRQPEAVEKFWSIPYAATGCILLGPGTSMTHQVAKFAASENLMIGFVGGGGSPLYFASQSEYRPTEYLQKWCSFWFDQSARLHVARFFLEKRAEYVGNCYKKLLRENAEVSNAIESLIDRCKTASTTEQLLGYEAVFAKRLYALWAKETGIEFVRTPKLKDAANRFLDNGNYLAYGLAASVLWVMGIPHAFPVMHGNTRRGALVFDLADLVKDACIMPAAFLGAQENDDEPKNRARCIAALDQFKALPVMFEAIKEAIDVGCGR